MTYLSNSCKYCNGDEECRCVCHHPNPERRDNRCDTEEWD